MALIEVSKGVTAEPEFQTAISVSNVLFATDFSSISEAALPYAAAICRHFGSTLHIAHIVSETGLLMMAGGVDYVGLGTMYEAATSEAKEKIEDISQQLRGIPHCSYVRHGQVWLNLAEIIAQNDIDLVVIGTHGRTGLGKLLLGSVAEDILRRTARPVLTVGPRVSGRNKLPAFRNRQRDLAPAELELRHIVLATNFAANATQVAEAAGRLAQSFGAQLTLMHVIEDYETLGRRPGPIENGAQRLRELIPATLKLPYTPETVLEFGSASERILKVAEAREADLIVLGARPAEGAGTARLPWSTANAVIARAHCPVLTLRD